jgi:hypothetical protein
MRTDGRQRGLCYLARLGYASRGAVYLLVGGLAVLAAFAGRGEAVDERDALSQLASHTGGKALLVAICIGLLGYALWRFIQAYYDVDHHGREAKGWAVRVGLIISGVANALLGVWVFTALLSGNGDDGGNAKHAWTARALEWPGGPWLVGLVGVVIIGVGVMVVVKGYRAKFEKYLTLDYQRWPWARPLCRFGLIARGVVFGVIGWFFVKAAMNHEAGHVGGIAKVFQELQRQPWGAVLFAVVALGLMAFGVYSLVEATYRRINPPADMTRAPG